MYGFAAKPDYTIMLVNAQLVGQTGKVTNGTTLKELAKQPILQMTEV